MTIGAQARFRQRKTCGEPVVQNITAGGVPKFVVTPALTWAAPLWKALWTIVYGGCDKNEKEASAGLLAARTPTGVAAPTPHHHFATVLT
jgi:hypothetical protein